MDVESECKVYEALMKRSYEQLEESLANHQEIMELIIKVMKDKTTESFITNR